MRMSNRLGEERTREEKAETRAVVSRGQDSRMCGKEEPLGSCQRVIGVGEIREERNGERMRREYGRGQGKKVEDKAERQEGKNPEKDTVVTKRGHVSIQEEAEGMMGRGWGGGDDGEGEDGASREKVGGGSVGGTCRG